MDSICQLNEWRRWHHHLHDGQCGVTLLTFWQTFPFCQRRATFVVCWFTGREMARGPSPDPPRGVCENLNEWINQQPSDLLTFQLPNNKNFKLGKKKCFEFEQFEWTQVAGAGYGGTECPDRRRLPQLFRRSFQFRLSAHRSALLPSPEGCHSATNLVETSPFRGDFEVANFYGTSNKVWITRSF